MVWTWGYTHALHEAGYWQFARFRSATGTQCPSCRVVFLLWLYRHGTRAASTVKSAKPPLPWSHTRVTRRSPTAMRKCILFDVVVAMHLNSELPVCISLAREKTGNELAGMPCGRHTAICNMESCARLSCCLKTIPRQILILIWRWQIHV